MSFVWKVLRYLLKALPLLIVLAFLFYRNVYSSLENITPDQMGDFLMIVSILLVTACFANFGVGALAHLEQQ